MSPDLELYGPLGLLGIAFLYLTRRKAPKPREPMTPPPPVGEADVLRERLRWLEEAWEREQEILRKAFSEDPAERREFDEMRDAALRERAREASKRADAELLHALDVLGLTREELSDPKRVRRAYGAKVKEAHPDRGGTEAALREVVAAWECLARHR